MQTSFYVNRKHASIAALVGFVVASLNGCSANAGDDAAATAASAESALSAAGAHKKSAKKQVCALLKGSKKAQKEFLDSAVFYGYTKSLSAVGLTGYAGQDSVWDLRHHQFSVSSYKGKGFATEIASAEIEFYAGVGVGFDHGVWDWDGWFVQSEVEVGLPYLKDFLSGSVTGFAKAIDKNHNGIISPTEVLLPPKGVYGSVGAVAVGVGVPIDPLPASINLTEERHESNNTAIRKRYNKMKAAGVYVRLVNHEGKLCPSKWPAVNPEDECVVEIGHHGDSMSQRALDVSKAMCAVANCDQPFGDALAVTAIAHGILWDIVKSDSPLNSVASFLCSL